MLFITIITILVSYLSSIFLPITNHLFMLCLINIPYYNYKHKPSKHIDCLIGRCYLIHSFYTGTGKSLLLVVQHFERLVIFTLNITIMIRFISLLFLLIKYFWVSMIECTYETNLRNNTEKSPYGITDASTEHKKFLMSNPVIEINICFLLDLDQYSCD